MGGPLIFSLILHCSFFSSFVRISPIPPSFNFVSSFFIPSSLFTAPSSSLFLSDFLSFLLHYIFVSLLFILSSVEDHLFSFFLPPPSSCPFLQIFSNFISHKLSVFLLSLCNRFPFLSSAVLSFYPPFLFLLLSLPPYFSY